ncbi:hypothetical protein K456DRAFT_1723490 [Colletotrichum gloeosporioides 23]|nr:hypothetical protein K456DRAFT_1723490 [Colletotrichum gloeosporioides 23]
MSIADSATTQLLHPKDKELVFLPHKKLSEPYGRPKYGWRGDIEPPNPTDKHPSNHNPPEKSHITDDAAQSRPPGRRILAVVLIQNLWNIVEYRHGAEKKD